MNNGLTVTTTTTSGYAFVISATQTQPLGGGNLYNERRFHSGRSPQHKISMDSSPLIPDIHSTGSPGTDYITYEASGSFPTVHSIAQASFPVGNLAGYLVRHFQRIFLRWRGKYLRGNVHGSRHRQLCNLHRTVQWSCSKQRFLLGENEGFSSQQRNAVHFFRGND